MVIFTGYLVNFCHFFKQKWGKKMNKIINNILFTIGIFFMHLKLFGTLDTEWKTLCSLVLDFFNIVSTTAV